jgi:hypothetical protein
MLQLGSDTGYADWFVQQQVADMQTNVANKVSHTNLVGWDILVCF